MGKSGFLCKLSILCVAVTIPLAASGIDLPGEGPALGPVEDRITQADIENDEFSLKELREAGLKIFTTPFNFFDGHGDGPMDPMDTTSPGGRPTLQDNGRFLRTNGLDSQTCLECHGVGSNATIPATPVVGGSGTINNVAMFLTQNMDIDDSDANGFAAFDGRLIVPPHTFGVGGVELLAKEMTQALQDLVAEAIDNPDVVISLDAKGIHFGTIVANAVGDLDTSGVEGIDEDLVVRPFGRKGDVATVREFDQGAMMFHLGMQPVEIVGEDVDADNDGVTNEILVGELSALDIFLTTQERPKQDHLSGEARDGKDHFAEVGCATCHRPNLTTDRKRLSYSFPEVHIDPFANIFYEVDLSQRPGSFKRSGRGIKVQLFSDLKRHDMGDDLAEDFHGASEQRNGEWITAKLWGVADTSPYMHDGRAQTLNEAILMHGGEAAASLEAYVALLDHEKAELILFLMTLRTPDAPNKDVVHSQARRGVPVGD